MKDFFIINKHNGEQLGMYATDLEDVKRAAESEMSYTGERVTIEWKNGTIITQSYWYFGEPKNYDVVLKKIGDGFYHKWSDEM